MAFLLPDVCTCCIDENAIAVASGVFAASGVGISASGVVASAAAVTSAA